MHTRLRKLTACVSSSISSVLVGLFDLVGCYLTLLTLLSTIQYFKLTERTNTLKGTLAKAGAAMSTFFLIFLLFFLVYTLVGSYMLGYRRRRSGFTPSVTHQPPPSLHTAHARAHARILPLAAQV